jgi:hypothetical protein
MTWRTRLIHARGGQGRAGRQQSEHDDAGGDRAQVLDVPEVLDVPHVPQMPGFPGRRGSPGTLR